MNKILFVDDEVSILEGHKRMLRPMRHEWDMSFAVGGREAIKLIEQESFEIIVTDMRMPDVDGLDVLKFAKEHDSSTTRIVLSGKSDKEPILRSSGMAHQFIYKPCEAEFLQHVIHRSLSSRKELGDEQIVKLVGGIDSLPSLPKIYQELTEEINKGSDDFSLGKVAQIISKDLSMTVKILQVANSAYYGSANKIETAQLATTYLGAEMIRTLVLTESVFREFSNNISTLCLDTLWRQSLSASHLAGLIAKEEKVEKQLIDQSVQAGSLHDIGKLMLATTMGSKYSEILTIAEKKSIPLHELEEEILGKDHGKVGAYLMGLWGLPDHLVSALAFHHCPQQSNQISADGFTPLIAVHVANGLLHAYKEGEEALDTYLNREWLESLGWGDRIERWTELVFDSLAEEEADL